MKLTRILQTSGVGLLVAGIVMASPVGAEVRETVAGGSGNPPAPRAGGRVPLSTPVPALTQAQRDLTEAAVKTDPTLAGIVGLRPYTIARVGPWTTVKGLQLLGAVVEIELAEPLATTADFPLLAYDETEKASPPYTVNRRALKVDSATVLSLIVEFRTNKVIAIRPVGDAVFTSVHPNENTNEGD